MAVKPHWRTDVDRTLRRHQFLRVGERDARRAGLLERDLIVLVDGASVGSVDDVHRLLVGREAGSLVTLTVLRSGKRREITVISGEA